MWVQAHHSSTPAFTQTVVQHQGQQSNTRKCLGSGEQKFGTLSGPQVRHDRSHSAKIRYIVKQTHSIGRHRAHRLCFSGFDSLSGFKVNWRVTCGLLSVFFKSQLLGEANDMWSVFGPPCDPSKQPVGFKVNLKSWHTALSWLRCRYNKSVKQENVMHTFNKPVSLLELKSRVK